MGQSFRLWVSRGMRAAASQRKRKLVEEAFGSGKTVWPLTKTMLSGLEHVGTQFTLTMAACSLTKLPKPLAA